MVRETSSKFMTAFTSSKSLAGKALEMTLILLSRQELHPCQKMKKRSVTTQKTNGHTKLVQKISPFPNKTKKGAPHASLYFNNRTVHSSSRPRIWVRGEKLQFRNESEGTCFSGSARKDHLVLVSDFWS